VTIDRLRQVWRVTRTISHHLLATKVDLGSGAHPKPGFVGVDSGAFEVEPPSEVLSFDPASGTPWPFADGQVTELRSSHLIEHLPALNVPVHCFVDDVGRRSEVPAFRRYVREQDALFWFMDEAWRICAPGALFELRWPALVDLRETPPRLPRWLTTAFIDPTHRRFIPVETLSYFSRSGRESLGVEGYAVSCDWRLEKLLQGELGQGHVENIAILERLPAEGRAE
jgi:hypothetical protein